ncbi:unnamed protein product (macronuclear) [Paramecium tetraurelia]|uniref:Vacuolar protein sorting-associated protein 26 n=1 Tax=Paramecium tetraurelia TaxID=5888 RepID=A0DIM8_PARTE|nr:uncharacterized protein GSPATT00017252001 [Paramecium tetraurelia]CAK82895.1 unnamed protein product [Paramecium tetraurelia]|eukprot:XP_001450292.1 hypothetical protein (macronuclear) [Paramecium tetraurelia strain d4-2]
MIRLLQRGSIAKFDIYLDGLDSRKTGRFNDKQQGLLKLPIYQGDDDISGVVDLKMNKNKKIEHLGIRIELIGRIEILNDQKQSSDFMSMGRELDAQGILMEDKTYKFQFNKFEKQYESYYGKEVKLRYYLRVTMNRNYGQVKKEVEFAVQIVEQDQEDQPQTSLKLEVGIEDCLHIDFEYFKSRYHLRDVVTGKVNFYLVKIKIKYMELAVIRKEQIGQGNTQQTENDILVKYELMDGCPQKGEVVPIRLFLSGIDMSPTLKNVSGKFSVKYILNLILIDEDDRKYFKQQEITVYRKK